MGGYECVTNKDRHNKYNGEAGYRVNDTHRWSETLDRGALSAWVYLGPRNDSEVLAKWSGRLYFHVRTSYFGLYRGVQGNGLKIQCNFQANTWKLREIFFSFPQSTPICHVSLFTCAFKC